MAVMDQQYLNERYQELAGYGDNPNQKYIARHQVVKSTLFIEAGSTLTKYRFFSNVNQGQQYQEGKFPNGAVAQDIMAMRISPAITFDVGVNTKTLGAELQRFLDDSYLQIDLQKSEQSKIWLSSLLPQGFTLNPDTGTDPAPLINHDKWGEWFTLRSPIKVGSNKNLDINFFPADELTVPVYGATITPHFPGSNLGNTEHGYCIRLFLDTIEYMPA